MNFESCWIPNKSLGPIVIGCNIEGYIEGLGAEYEESSREDSSQWDTYVLPEQDVYIDVSNGRVVSVTAYREFFYKGTNLIGMSMVGLNQMLGCLPDDIGDPVEYCDGDVKIPYDYFELGLQVWASSGGVTSATCLSYDDD